MNPRRTLRMRLRRLLTRAALALLLLLLAAVAAGWWRWRAPLPQTDGTLTVAGLGEALTITRDAYGVPRARAASEEDAAYATGFLHGQDRLFQMDLTRRVSAGRLAEIFGSRALEADRRARRQGHRARSEADLAALSGGDRDILEAYARGVNAAVASAAALPVEYALLGAGFEPWAAVDSLLAVRTMQERLLLSSRELTRYRLAERVGIEAAAWLADGMLRDDAVVLSRDDDEGLRQAAATETRRRLRREAAALGLPESPPEKKPASTLASHLLLEESRGWGDAALGSNSWVVSGRRSASGGPLLANDTHLALDTPAPFYMMRLQWPEVQVAGVTVPGFPGVVIGRNRQLAWSVTILTADTIDYVVETLHPEDPDRYRVMNGERVTWQAFQRRLEEIGVKGAEAATETVLLSRHGPVVDAAWRPGKALVRASHPTAPPGALSAIRGYARAGNVDALQAAARAHDLPPENILYASAAGPIGYLAAGALPLRDGHSGLLPVPGDRKARIYRSYDDPVDRPGRRDPVEGFLATANNQVLAGPRGDEWNRSWIRADRAARAGELLAQVGQHDAATFRAMQADTYSRQADLMLSTLQAAAGTGRWQPAAPGAAADAWQILKRWDRHYEEGPAPGLFALFRDALLHQVFDDELGEALATAAGAGLLKLLTPEHFHDADGQPAEVDWWDDSTTTERRETMADQVPAALARAWAGMEERAPGGADAWHWPDLHQARFVHPLGRQAWLAPLFNGPSLPVGGAGGVLLANAFSAGRSFDVFAIPAMRMIADMAPGGGLRMVVPIGQSGIPASRHFADLAGAWLAVSDMEVFHDAAPGAARLYLEPAP